MDGPALARILAIIVIAIALTAAAIDMARRGRPAPPRPLAPVTIEAPDPHRAALARCQEMGEAAIRDAECLAVWAENRRRFLRPSERP
jgi:conjugative transfer region protein TrbK